MKGDRKNPMKMQNQFAVSGMTVTADYSSFTAKPLIFKMPQNAMHAS